MLAIQPSTPTPRRTSSTLRRDETEGVASGCMSGAWLELLAESADVGDEVVHLLWRQLVPVRVHPLRLSLALEAVEDGLLHLRVAGLLLEPRRGHVRNLELLARLGLGASVDSMAARAFR